MYREGARSIAGRASQSAPSKLGLITQNQLALLVRRVFVRPWWRVIYWHLLIRDKSNWRLSSNEALEIWRPDEQIGRWAPRRRRPALRSPYCQLPLMFWRAHLILQSMISTASFLIDNYPRYDFQNSIN